MNKPKESKTVRRNLIIDENLLSEAAAASKRIGIPVNAFIAQAIRDKLDSEKAADTLRAATDMLEGALKNGDISNLDETERRAADALLLLGGFFKK